VIRIAAAVLTLAGLLALISGLLFWTGTALNLITLHMLLGFLAVGALWVIGAAQALAPRGSWGIAACALIIGAVMIVLGISETHCATAAILRDGAIVACASEERFSRLKNDAGYPRLAVDALLRELGLHAHQIDLVALAGRRAYARDWMNRVLHDGDYAREYYGVRLQEPRAGLGKRARKLGFRARMRTANGRKLINAKRRTGRKVQVV